MQELINANNRETAITDCISCRVRNSMSSDICNIDNYVPRSDASATRGERVRESEEETGQRDLIHIFTVIHTVPSKVTLFERFLETISRLLSSRGEILRPSGHLGRTTRRSGT